MVTPLLRLNVKCDGDEGKCICTKENKPGGIKASKVTTIGDVTNFTKYVHTIPNGTTFNLSNELSNGENVGTVGRKTGETIPDVKEVSVYYWDGNLGEPILIEVKDRTHITKYYSYYGYNRGKGNWRSFSPDSNKPLEQLLDEKNCSRNNAVPFDIQNPRKYCIKYDSFCIKDYRRITGPNSTVTIPGYDVKEYSVSGGDTKISRVTFGGQNITGIATNGMISRIRIYQWKHEGTVPLFVEFIDKTNKSTFFENLDKKSLNWRVAIGIFYGPNNTYPLPDLTDKLDEINCNINNTADIYTRKTTGTDKYIKYCHGRIGGGHVKKISVELYKDIIVNGFVTYNHYWEGSAIFNISGFKDYITLSGFDLPLRNVERVLVFSYKCSSGQYERPLVIYVDHQDCNKNKWYQRGTIQEDSGNTWQEMLDMKDEDPYNPNNIEKIRRGLESVAQTLGEPSCSQPRPKMAQIGSNIDSEKSDDEEEYPIITYPLLPTTVPAALAGYRGSSGNSGRGGSSVPSSGSSQSSYQQDDTGTPPVVTIDIYKRSIAIEKTYYDDAYDFQSIDVSPDFNIDNFTKYKHTVQGRKCFTLKQVKYKGDHTGIATELSMSKVIQLSVYYWSLLETRSQNASRPLLVKITTNTPGETQNTETYYENTGDIGDLNWQLVRESLSASNSLQSKLNLLNCRLNNAVIIDVSQKRNPGSYDVCKDGEKLDPNHATEKMKVEKDKGDTYTLKNYDVYKHTLNNPTLNGLFHIVGLENFGAIIILNGLQTIPSSLILGVDVVKVYFCPSDPNHPLLIYYHKPREMPEHYWYKNTNGRTPSTWVQVESDGLSNTDDTTKYDKILTILDSLTSPCKPPEVTIDLYERFIIGSSTKYYGGNKHWINVYGSESIEEAEFTEYQHTFQGRNKYFTVSDFKYNGRSVTGEDLKEPTKYVKGVSVFYWIYLEPPYKLKDQRGRPLLVKVVTMKPGSQETTETYYENNGDSGDLSWKVTTINPSSDLEKKLKLLNCRLNNAVIIDISIKHDLFYDACERNILDPYHITQKIEVKKDHTSDNKLGTYAAYTHKFRTPPGEKFHVLSFKNAGMTLTGIGYPPILDVDLLNVYFCSLDNKPLLLHYKKNTWEGTYEYHWYKNEKPNDKSGSWEVVTGFIQTTYDDEEIKRVLDLKSSCKSQPTTSITNDQSSVSVVQPKVQQGPNKPSELSDTPQDVEPPKTGRLAITLPAVTGLGYIIPSVFGGSAATFFGGWKLYNRYKGDPWVRQI